MSTKFALLMAITNHLTSSLTFFSTQRVHLLKIILPTSRNSHLVTMCPNSHTKLIKGIIRSIWSGFEHCSKSLVYHEKLIKYESSKSYYLLQFVFIFHYLSIFTPIYLCAIFILHRYSIETAIGHGDIAFKRFGGYRKCTPECSLGVNLVTDNLLCSFRYFTSVSNVKAIGPLLQ